MMRWTEEMTSELTRLHADGLSFARMAQRMTEKFGVPFTRNSCTGQANRMKLPARERVGDKDRSVTMRIKRKPKFKLIGPSEAPHQFLGIPFLDLEPQHCRYPVGEDAAMLFCGQPRMEGSSYCEFCHAICHTAPASKGQRIEAARKYGEAA
jgi:hypothetical protein